MHFYNSQLYHGGITNLDALEPSAEMLNVSQRLGIYQRIIHVRIAICFCYSNPFLPEMLAVKEKANNAVIKLESFT